MSAPSLVLALSHLIHRYTDASPQVKDVLQAATVWVVIGVYCAWEILSWIIK